MSILLSGDARDPNSPATTSLFYEEMAPRWSRISPLLGGTEAMKQAGAFLLPQHEEESNKSWQERLEMNVLFNMTEITLQSWVGRPFSDPVELSDDTPTNIAELQDDVDLQGNSLDVFARNWFKEGLAKAFSHVLIDFPALDPVNPDGTERTMEDDLREGVRPYWVSVCPENLFAARARVVDGREVLTHARILEMVTEPDGWSEVLIPQIRVFDAAVPMEDGTSRTLVRIFRKRKIKGGKEEWVEFDARFLSIDFIPIVTFYADRSSFMVGKPPIADLADLNIRWWQSNSDQIAILTVSRFPILAGSGVGGSDKVTIGPHTWLTTTDPNGKWYYVEHEGKAIAAGEKDLQKLEMSMAEYGAEFLKKRPDRETALARALDSAEATSPLMDATLRFNDSLNTAMEMTGRWMGNERGRSGSAKIRHDFGPEEISKEDFEALKFARENGDLSREQYLSELRRRGSLPDGFDMAENLRQLRLEGRRQESQEEEEEN